jgi:hypothetical protein
MIDILHVADNRNISGTFTSLIDVYYNLLNNNYTNVKLHILCYTDILNVFKLYQSFIKTFCPNVGISYHHINQFDSIKTDILITTTELLSFYYMHSNYIPKLNYNKFIVLDSAGFYQSYEEEQFKDCFRVIPNDAIILCNKANLKLSPWKNSYEYYIKLSEDRLSILKQYSVPISNDRLKSSYYIPIDAKYVYNDLKKQKILTTDIYKVYEVHFCRRYLSSTGTYSENIGKLIFEMIWLDRPVYYYSKPKTFDDGLHYYLQLFNVDDNKDQLLSITKEDIEDKLFIHDDDLLYKIIED